MHEALLYEHLDHQRVRCNLCGHRCVIPANKQGVCQVRENQHGTLYTLVYGKQISSHIDPIEKKPLYHFLPGSRSYSIATPGCNFQCQWCQNWQIAHLPRFKDINSIDHTPPEKIVRSASSSKCESIAYTYTEPTIFFEYAYDTAILAHQNGIANVFVTNGYMTTEMLNLIHPVLDAANVDLKAFRKTTYHKSIGAGLQQVLDSMKTMKALGIWLEVTTLVIPGLNDDPAELKDIADFIAAELGEDTPWHISRYFPQYQFTNTPATPRQTLKKAEAIGKSAGLQYVYLGNIHGESNTHCQNCSQILVGRIGYQIQKNNIHDNKCKNCQAEIPGIWE